MEKQKAIGDYIIISKLGTGSYGIVYKVKKKNKNNIYVIKQISFDNLSSKQIFEVKQEAKILSSINSIYVVKYYDSFEENNCLNIVMEYCDGGDLSAFLNNNKKTKILLKEDLVWTLFLKITIGLAAIHNLKILHRDLKTLNIFLTKELDIKIGDLGVAKILTHTKFAKTFIGTPYYLSPEICEDRPYNDKSDVWALGCILYELCTYRHPFEAKSQGALILKILKSQPTPIHNYYSNDLQELIYTLLEKDEEIRPSCNDILMFPNIIDKLRKYGLINKIKFLNPYYNNNNINYDYYQKDENKYIYDKNNNIYNYYIDGYNNNYIYDSNAGYNNNCYYVSDSKNYYSNNNKQKIISFENNNNANNVNYYPNGIYNSNSERNFKNNLYINYNNAKNNQLNNNNHKKINNNYKKICSFCLDSNINNIKIIDKKNEAYKIGINPKLRKHNSDNYENYQKKNNEKNENERKINLNNHKITYINAIKYIKKPTKNMNIKELLRNRSNDNYEKHQKLNIEFNNIKENNKNNSKNNLIEIKLKEKISPIKLIKEINEKREINNNQANNKINIIKSERKNDQKLLDTITEFANNLNKYVNQHNSAQKNKDNLPESFTLQTIDNDDLKSEECPKDNIRNRNKNNSETLVKKNTNYSSFVENIENDEFKIIDNIEKENKNENIGELTITPLNSSKEIKHPISVSKDVANIDSTKLNSIIQNHKNLKIFKNDEKNEEENNIDENKEKEKEKDKQFEENLYSSEEEKGANIYDSEEESESKSEKVKEIKERKTRDSSMTKSLSLLSNEEIKNKLKNERDNLKEKIENTKNDMLNLLGKEDYNYIIDLYVKVENNFGEVDEIYKKIEEYIKSKYQNDKRENFDELYFSLISYDCQLAKKEQQLKKYV